MDEWEGEVEVEAADTEEVREDNAGACRGFFPVMCISFFLYGL